MLSGTSLVALALVALLLLQPHIAAAQSCGSDHEACSEGTYCSTVGVCLSCALCRIAANSIDDCSVCGDEPALEATKEPSSGASCRSHSGCTAGLEYCDNHNGKWRLLCCCWSGLRLCATVPPCRSAHLTVCCHCAVPPLPPQSASLAEDASLWATVSTALAPAGATCSLETAAAYVVAEPGRPQWHPTQLKLTPRAAYFSCPIGCVAARRVPRL